MVLELNRKKLFLVCLLLLAIGIKLIDFKEPFISYNMSGAPIYAHIARNLNNYGFKFCKFGPVDNVDKITENSRLHFDDSNFSIGHLLNALSFKIFGVKEWSYRLVLFVFSLFSFYGIYLVLVELFADEKIFVKFGLLFALFIPLDLYFYQTGSLTEMNKLFIIFTILFYIRFLKTAKKKTLLAVWIFSILGVLTERYSLEFAFFLPIHYFLYTKFICKENYQKKYMISLLLLFFICFLLYFINYFYYTGYADFIKHLKYRALDKLEIASENTEKIKWNIFSFPAMIIYNFSKICSPMIVMLAILGLIFSIKNLYLIDYRVIASIIILIFFSCFSEIIILQQVWFLFTDWLANYTILFWLISAVLGFKFFLSFKEKNKIIFLILVILTHIIIFYFYFFQLKRGFYAYSFFKKISVYLIYFLPILLLPIIWILYKKNNIKLAFYKLALILIFIGYSISVCLIYSMQRTYVYWYKQSNLFKEYSENVDFILTDLETPPAYYGNFYIAKPYAKLTDKKIIIDYFEKKNNFVFISNRYYNELTNYYKTNKNNLIFIYRQNK